ncbi:MAG: DUF1287 domain-containing protein [Alphaproteobacteria bacterium]|nr:DUF1287 domain-containing protein [Alphaproteobacteria bacterium]
MVSRRLVLAAAGWALALPARAQTWQERLVSAAEEQIGRTVVYDPAYVRLAYPGGDVPAERGVCTDVVIRAYRAGLGIDLQKRVHQDMAANFAAYPAMWGLARPDHNIDHRRVPNLQTYFRRKGAALPMSDRGSDYRAGDLVTMMLPGNLPHIGIVSATMAADGRRPMLIHNIGAGARKEDVLFTFRLTGHYRYGG